MLDNALKILREFDEHSYKAYIVGGFVRDYILGSESKDIDITTNATPKEIKEIFLDSCLPNDDYGSVIVIKNGIRYEITTFRRENNYIDHRKPSEVHYIDELYPDLLRRDFVINTLCMDKDGNIVDYLGGKDDIDHKIIRTVGDAFFKFQEDSLRILRAIRFATILDFDLSQSVKDAIVYSKSYVRRLTYYRKKEELDKIFNCPNRDKGIQFLLEFGLDEELELSNLDKVLYSQVNSSLAIWSMLDVVDKYPFSKNEVEIIENINEAMQYNNLDPMALYRYGLYVSSCAGVLKGLDLKHINESYSNLVIKCRDDIDIDSNCIMELLNREPGKYIKDIYEDVEREILYRRLDNNHDMLCEYILKNYG